MSSARITSIVVLAAAIVGGLTVQAADDGASRGPDDALALSAGAEMPSARAEPTLSSTWFCAGGTAAEGGFADHVLVIANPTDQARSATVTVLTGVIAEAPVAPADEPAAEGEGEADAAVETTTTAEATTTTAATTTTTRPDPAQKVVELPGQSRVEVRVGDISAAPLAGAIVEVDGGSIAVEHQIAGDLGRATAPCSSTASPSWSFPWGVTSRGQHELLVFMNPFPDDATVDISLATDEGVREPARFQGFVVPGRSVVGAYLDQDTRRDQVSAQVEVLGGRLIIDRIQTFDGTDGRKGMTLGLGVPTPGEAWLFPMGETGEGLGEQVVVFNPSTEVAEVEVEVRLDDPGEGGPPEPFELTMPPGRYSLIDVSAEERIPSGVGHSVIVRSLNGVAVAAERVNSGADPAGHTGITATTGSPLAAPVWFFAAGGPVADELDEYLVLLNPSDDEVTFRVTGFSTGKTIAIEGLQDGTIVGGARAVIRLGDHIDRADLSVEVRASGPIVAERGLYRIGGGSISQAIGIPLAEDLVRP